MLAEFVKAIQPLTLTLTATNVSCNGLQDGSVQAVITGGQPPYHVVWNTGVTDSLELQGLQSGSYDASITDANGAMTKEVISVTQPEPLVTTQFEPSYYGAAGFNTSCFYCWDGQINVTADGGTAPYSYLWNDGVTTANRTNLPPRTYILEITDAHGCRLQGSSITILAPDRDDWTAGGNSSSDTSIYFGTKATSTFKDLVFKSGGNEGFRLLQNKDALFKGRVGIGTTTPTEKFEVSGGNVKFGGDLRVGGNTVLNGTLRISNLADSVGGLLGYGANGELRNPSRDEIIRLIYEPINCSLVSSATTIFNPPHWSVNEVIATGPQQSVISYKKELISCFNVGIKTGTPQYDLDVNGSINGHNFLKDGVPIQFSQWINNTNGSGMHYLGGNIGIGTNYPQYRLDIQDAGNYPLRVKGDVNIGHYIDDNEYLWLKSDGANGTIDYYGLNPGGSLSLNFHSHKKVVVGDGGLEVIGGVVSRNNLNVEYDTNNWLNLSSSGDYSRFICSRSAAIFIGAESGYSNEEFRIEKNSNYFGGGDETLFEVLEDGRTIIHSYAGVSENDKILTILNSAGTEVFRVSGSGKSFATKMRVQSASFPDYVFKKEYELTPLEVVENYTKENSHLPNMPTESEVVNDGLDVSEVIVKNTENIEQLYLYLFEMKKEIEKLKLENKMLKNEK